eukprot:RCo031032
METTSAEQDAVLSEDERVESVVAVLSEPSAVAGAPVASASLVAEQTLASKPAPPKPRPASKATTRVKGESFPDRLEKLLTPEGIQEYINAQKDKDDSTTVSDGPGTPALSKRSGPVSQRKRKAGGADPKERPAAEAAKDTKEKEEESGRLELTKGKKSAQSREDKPVKGRHLERTKG